MLTRKRAKTRAKKMYDAVFARVIPSMNLKYGTTTTTTKDN